MSEYTDKVVLCTSILFQMSMFGRLYCTVCLPFVMFRGRPKGGGEFFTCNNTVLSVCKCTVLSEYV